MSPNFVSAIFSAALITGCLSAPSGPVPVAHPKAHTVVAVAPAPVVAAAVSAQHHAQDELGQYSYGYSNPLSAKEEVKTVDGITRGGYSYLDSHGLVQSVNYVSDDVNGFRVAASNLPLGPVVPAQDEPVVAHAKAQAVAALAEAAVKDAAEDAAQAAANAEAASEPLKPIVVPPLPVAADAVAVETNPPDAPAVPESTPVYAAVPEAEVVAVTPVPPAAAHVVPNTYPVYYHPPAAVPVGQVHAPVPVAAKAVSVIPAGGLEVAVTPAPVVASPVPVSAATVAASAAPAAVAYSVTQPPVVAVTPAPVLVDHSAGPVVAITPAPVFVSAAPAPAVVTKTVAAVPVPAPAPVAAPAVPVVAGVVTTQHHAQDELGQYSYGYSNPLSAKEEVKTFDGITRGGYSYLDSNGAVQNVNYVSDHVNGFRVAASNLPVQPVHVSLPDSPDVASAKVKFFAEIANAKEAVEAANREDAALLAHAHVQPLPHAYPHYPHAHAHYVH